MKARLFLLCCLAWLSLSSISYAADSTALFTAAPAMQNIQLTGFTRAKTELNLVSELSGRCLTVKADVGDTISAQGVFACLDPTFIRLDIEANQVEQNRLQTDITFYQKEVGRLQKLVRNTAVAQADLDQKQNLLDSTRYQLKALQVASRRLNEQLNRLCLKAPPRWQVIQRSIEPEQWINVGQTVAQVGDFSELYVPFALSSHEYLALQKMPTLQVTLPDFGLTVPAKIARISPSFDPETRKINLELSISEAVPVMRGGWRVQLNLQLADDNGVVLVPETALRERYEEWFLLTPEGEQRQVVKLGLGREAGQVRVQGKNVTAGEQFRVSAIGD